MNVFGFIPGGKKMVLTTGDGKINVWDAIEKRFEKGERMPNRELQELAISPDGKTVAIACRDRVIWLWDIATGRFGKLAEPYFETRDAYVTSVSYSHDGKMLAVGMMISYGGRIVLFDTSSGDVIYEKITRSLVHRVRLSFDDQTLHGQYVTHYYKIWDWKTGKEYNSDHRAADTTLSPNGVHAAGMSGNDKKRGLEIWEYKTNKHLRKLYVKDANGEHALPLSFQFSPTGRTVAVGTAPGKITIFSITSGDVMHTLLNPEGASSITFITFSFDGLSIAANATSNTRNCMLMFPIPANTEDLFGDIKSSACPAAESMGNE